MALLACGPGDPPSPPRGPEPDPPTEDPQPAPQEPQPEVQPQPPPGEPEPPPQQACDPEGSWLLSFARTDADGAFCGQPGLASSSWTIRIFDVQATRFSYEGENTRGNPVGGTATLAASTCEATIRTVFDGVIATQAGGTPIFGRITSDHRMTFGAETVEGEGRETFASDEPHPSFPCTVTWRVHGMR